MALVIDLKPNERLLVGNTVITNDDQRTRIRIDGDAPILREKDTMTLEQANTHAKKLYFTIQEMYLMTTDKALSCLDTYFAVIKPIENLAPHISNFLNDISLNILQGHYYKGLKQVQDLINYQENNQSPPENKGKEEEKLNHNFMEAMLLNQSAEQMEEIYNNWDETQEKEIENTISYNRKLWMAFFEGIGERDSSQQKSKSKDNGFDVLANIIHLYNFIYKRSAEIIETKDKEKILTLIEINRQTAIGLKRY